ncbi:PREDICTED: NFX1-type zinc finger-containing protein 1-like [Branchiostoma belcheri]|uniref:NFX1-type zinc finger-containing protein 1-like n=1 Tax=Branchiostoma belcheri TaxID=7741 RepID=A0A6P5AEC4_BRABE|nr:PREDICTED: NFX1-type zinc finger-containing protein 1-like [Branchiostoma belcheri]
MEGDSGSSFSYSYRGRPGRGRGDFGRRDGQRGGRREHATRRETPPDDFRELSVIPTFYDIHTDKDPFLRPNIVRGRYPDVDTYLDVQFRLLREDFVRPLREGITDFLNMRRRGSGRQAGTPQDIYVYYDVHVAYPTYAHNGIVYRIQFDSSRPELQRVRWQQSKRLIYGSLVCLSSDEFQTMFFATVANRDLKQLGQGWVEVRFEGDTSEVLDISPMETFIMVESTAFFESYRHVLKGLQEVDQNTMPFLKYIVDCDCANGVDPPAYLRGVTYDLSVVAENVHGSRTRSVRSVPVLRDNMWPSAEDLNFDESQYRAFKLGLTKEFAIIQGPPGTGKTYIGLKIIEVLLKNSHKWRGVQRGLEAAGPILVVCYTNHALDQFLEGIADSYHKGIVRVGGQSKSEKLKQFNLKNIRNKRRQKKKHKGAADATRKMKRLQEQMDVYLDQLTATQNGLLHEDTLMLDQRHRDSLMQGSAKQNEDRWMLGGKKRESVIVDWLGLGEQALPGADRQNHDAQAEDEEEVGIEIMDIPEEQRLLDDVEPLYGRGNSRQHRRNYNSVVDLALDLENMQIKDRRAGDPEGWQVQSNKKKRRNELRRELSKTEMMTQEEVRNVPNIWKLQLNDRWRLYRYWLAKYHAHHRQFIRKYVDQYEEVARRLEGYRNEEDRRIMEEACVVGMTTTGAAKYHSILQDIQPAIVIVEEAAEVLEAHIVTTLSQHCQHLILIGDHQQLRPKPTVYDLETNYNMGISLFERMIMNGMQCQRLQSQHRMRPEFARLLTPHIYESLDNHESVLNFDNIKGVSSNMFFVNHTHREEQKRDTKSRSNMHEAEFMAAFCRYLLQQGYSPSQITILTTYTGQLQNFKKAMPRQVFDGVRVSTVDSFQGEESDIILLSLVRSNDEGNVGFLKVDNRVCVALSRAKKGFFTIGNLMMLAKASTLWIKIIQELLQQKSVGESLTLSCQNHPDSEILVSTSDDFEKAPNGGCMRPCTFRLQCGHVCEMRCHPTDPDHEEYKCQKPCDKVICDLGHRCQRLCSQPCGKCQVLVDKTFPRCPHKQTIPCYKKDDDDLVCNAPCTRLFKCGHRCAGTCDSCRQRRMHEPCREPCNRVLVCSHQCSAPCGEPCAPCQMPCEWRCRHYQCEMPCGEPCDRPRCNRPCRKTRRCGKCKKARPCIGMCGEPCPDKCRICDREELTEIIFGIEDEPDARFLQLQDCGHVIEVRGLDQWMDITDRNIRLKTCPKCKTPIRHNLRYGNTIKKTMEKIKKVQNVPNTQRETPTNRLLDKNRSRGVDQREYRRAQSAASFWHDQQVESRLSSPPDHQGTMKKMVRRKEDKGEENERKITELQRDIDDLEKWLLQHGTADVSKQERQKFGGELTRLKYLLKLRILQRRIRKNGISLDELEQKYLAMAERRLTAGEPLTEQKEEFIKHVLSRLSWC